MTTISDTLALSSGTVLEGRSVGSGTWNYVVSLSYVKGNAGGTAVEQTTSSANILPYYPASGGSSGGSFQQLATSSVYAQAEFQMLTSSTDRYFGLRLRQSALNFYLLRWYGGNLEIYKNVSGVYTLLGQTAFSVSLSTWYTLRAEVSDGRQYIAIGATSLTTTDTAISFSGSANGCGLDFYSTRACVAGSDTIQARNFEAGDAAAVGSSIHRHRPRGLYIR